VKHEVPVMMMVIVSDRLKCFTVIMALHVSFVHNARCESRSCF